MVQVDIFWAYALGGSLSAAAGRQLRAEPRPFASRYFVHAILFLALVWSPTGLLLLLRHPSWETMQVAPSLTAIPPFLVLAFGITNVTQGLVGFYVGQRLMARGRHDLAHLNWLAGYLAMFFILLYGWDGRGYDRFLYDRGVFGGAAWSAGAGIGPHAGLAFLRSTVAATLYLDGLFLVPPMLYAFGRWTRDGAPRASASVAAYAGWYLVAVLLVTLPIAGALALGVYAAERALHAVGIAGALGHGLAYVVGLPVTALVLRVALWGPGRPGPWLVRRLYARDDAATSSIALTAGAATP